ncbi:MAG TPA: hypothetical protein VEA60_06725 [Allosphingosinicella sp.]|nr:hypothetical protein [Allosphingosinicella sp.]
MFEKLISRAAALAGSAARRRRDELAEAWREEAPAGVRIDPAPEGVLLSGRDLARRFALDPALRLLGRGR